MRITLDRGTVTCECGEQHLHEDDAVIVDHLVEQHRVLLAQAKQVVASLRRRYATFKVVTF